MENKEGYKSYMITNGYEIIYEDNCFKICKDDKEVELNFNNNSIWVREDNDTKVHIEY